MSPGPAIWRMILAKETASTAASFSTTSTAWSATNIGEITAPMDRRFSFRLNQPQTISFSLPLTDPLAAEIVTLTNSAASVPIIKLYRETTLMMVADILSAEIVSSPSNGIATVAVVATETMWARLPKRMIAASKRTTGYRIGTASERTTLVKDALTELNRTPANMLPEYNIQSEFNNKITGWSPVTILWGGGASTLTRQTGGWDTDSNAGFMRLTGTKDASATRRYISASTASGTSGIPVTGGQVYSFSSTIRTIDAAAGGAGNGVYLQINWYQSGGAASAIVSATSTATQNYSNGTTNTLYGAVGAPSDAAFAQISFGVTSATSGDTISYGFDNASFGPEAQSGIVSDVSSYTTSTFGGGPWYYKPFMEFVQEVGLTLSGFDFYQAPLDPVSNNGTSGTFIALGTRGTSKPNAIFEYGIGKHNVVNYRLGLDGSDMITTAYSLPSSFPSGGSAAVASISADGITRLRTREDLISSDLIDSAARKVLASEHVRIRKYYKIVLSFTPQVEDGSRTPKFGVDYDIGDTVTARIKDQGVLMINSTVRIYGADIELDQNGLASTNLILVKEAA